MYSLIFQLQDLNVKLQRYVGKTMKLLHFNMWFGVNTASTLDVGVPTKIHFLVIDIMPC